MTAAPPRPPTLTAANKRAAEEQRKRLLHAEAVERQRMLRGLLLLGTVVLLGSMVHAGWHRVFVPGWWRQW